MSDFMSKHVELMPAQASVFPLMWTYLRWAPRRRKADPSRCMWTRGACAAFIPKTDR
jgi:hypothetical protein